MNVLIVGGGAREHVLAWKLRQSPLLTDLFVAPGNAGTSVIAQNLPAGEMDFAGLHAAAVEHRVELVVIGPEAPLAAGLADYLLARGLLVYGPTRAAAEIESSKVWAKQLMRRAGIPTAAASAFEDVAAARRFALASDRPPVVKADGLAAGKGVVVAESQSEALAAIDAAMTDGAFGEAGRRLLLEERLTGVEVSAHVFSDGTRALPMPFACDHKRIFDGDRGPNTGGMGAFSPPPFVSDALAQQLLAGISQPAVSALADAGRPFRGTLYPGLMLTDGGPRVIEFNCRFGDPETQVLLPRLASDLLPLLLGAARGDLSEAALEWDAAACVGVVIASGGYPGAYATGLPVDGLDELDDDMLVFHAGTVSEGGRVLTAGGRVLTLVGRGATIAAARERVYANIDRIHFTGAQYRGDIGLRGL